MKVGDLVELHNRFFRENGKPVNAPTGMYLIIEQLPGLKEIALDKHDQPTTMRARWSIMNIETGKVYRQIGRDLEVVNESR